MTRDEVPRSGTVEWPGPEAAYTDIIPNHPYPIKIANDMPCIFIHVGFFDNQQLCLSNGEVTQDVLNRAIFKQ